MALGMVSRGPYSMLLEGHHQKVGRSSAQSERAHVTQGRLSAPWDEELSHPLSQRSCHGSVKKWDSSEGC